MEKTRIFISYRREDSAGYAGRLSDRLVTEFGFEQVFFDIDTILAGDDFVEVLTEKVESCDVLFAVIGKSWLTIADAAGQPRIQNPEDFVAIEIGAALKWKVRVIPILVGGGRMPMSSELPEALTPLARRQAHELPDKGFIPALEKLFPILKQVALTDRQVSVPPNAEIDSRPPRSRHRQVECELLKRAIEGTDPHGYPIDLPTLELQMKENVQGIERDDVRDAITRLFENKLLRVFKWNDLTGEYIEYTGKNDAFTFNGTLFLKCTSYSKQYLENPPA